MIRKLIQFALCIFLCPLLVAQQASQAVSPSDATLPQPDPATQYVTLPSDTNLELLPPGPTAFAQERAGRVVRFVVDKDVAPGGVSVVHAGVPVVGVVGYVKRASHFKHRATEMEIRVTEMVSGKPIELHLRCFDFDDSTVASYSQRRPGAGFDPIKWGIIAGLILAGVAAFAGDK